MDIRKILDVINKMGSGSAPVNESKFGKGIEVMSLDQFVDSSRKEVDEEIGGGFNPKLMAQANKERIRKEREQAKLDKQLAKQQARTVNKAADREAAKQRKAELYDRLYYKVIDAVSNSFPDGDPIDYFMGFLERNDLDMDDVDKVFKQREGRTYHDYLIDMWDDFARDAAYDANSQLARGIEPDESPFWDYETGDKQVTLNPNPWGTRSKPRKLREGKRFSPQKSHFPEFKGMTTAEVEKLADEAERERKKLSLAKGMKDSVIKNAKDKELKLAKELQARKGYEENWDEETVNESWGDGQYADQLQKHAQKILQNKLDVNKYAKHLFYKLNWDEKTNNTVEEIAHDLYNTIKYLPGGKKFKNPTPIVNPWGIQGEESVSEAFKLGGAIGKDLSDDELKGYLDRIIKKTKEKREKYTMPYIHGSNVKGIVDSSGNLYDLEKLKNLFTERPTKILKQNEKMKHSDGTSSVFFNIGLPAMTGLAYDEDDKKFVVVNTCPGAGSCKLYCYATKGGYIQYAPPSTHMTRVLNFLLNDPEGFKAQLNSEISEAENKFGKKNSKVVIRWHDAGDFFSPNYLNLAYSIAKKHPDVLFYAYTKLAGVAQSSKPDNFIINFSMGAQPKQEKQIDFTKTKHSKVVPGDVFSDLVTRKEVPVTDKKGNPKIDKETGKPEVEKKLVYKGDDSIKALKDRLAAKYSIKPNSILTYDEMLKTPEGKPGQYNVIVKPGDGDISASRRDVLGTYLLIH